jgi:hypothetical protein
MSASVPEAKISWQRTDPGARIELAEYSGIKDNKTIPLLATYQTFFESLAEPDQIRHTKDGRSFMIGPCPSKRSGRNLTKAYIAVLDADKSLGDKHVPVDGAPSPIRVHEVLTQYDISHCLYTSYSHGSAKGNRYRVVFPVEATCAAELEGLMVYIVGVLQEHGLPLALSRESYVWGQGWYYPRTPYEGADYIWRLHWGKTPDLAELAATYGLHQQRRRMGAAVFSDELHPSSPLGLIAKALPIPVQLEQAGYEFISQGTQLDEDGQDVPVLRYRKPGSTSAPGVCVYYSRNRWRCYSFHTDDPLNNGHANDSCDVYRLLNELPTTEAAIKALVPVVQDFIIDELQNEYPSVLEGGVRFRYGNRYVDDTGAMAYRMMDQAAFSAAMQNQPGVPIISAEKEGEEQVKMLPRDVFWKACRDRVVYNGLCYQPCPITESPELVVQKQGKPYFNMFRTWQIVPKAGRWDLLEWHLRHAICGSKEDEYEYLLDWFAHMFQFPFEKPGVALVLQGGRGWGKSILLQELCLRLGPHAFIAGNNRLLTGNFNSHLRNKLMLVVEESFWSGNHKDRGVLQHLVTDQITGFEQKGVDAESGLSYLRVVMITNEDWAVPAATDERRYFPPSLSDVAKRQKFLDINSGNTSNHYFIRLQTELKNGGLEAFIDFVSKRSFDRDRIRMVPNTSKLQEQKHLSLDWIDKWLHEVLTDGVIRSKAYGLAPLTASGGYVSALLLADALKEAAPQAVINSDKGVMTQFGMRISKIFRAGQITRKRAADGVYYNFAPVAKLRATFERYSGLDIDWLDAVTYTDLPDVLGTRNEHGTGSTPTYN